MRIFAAALILVSATALADAPKFEIKDNRLVVPHEVTFETGKATLKPASSDAIDYVKAYLTDKTYITAMRVEVHTDTQGKADDNQKLSEARALAVAKAIVAKGIDCKRLVPVGFGGQKPIATNDTIEGRAQNRRVEFANAALRDRPIGGQPLDGGGKLAGDPCK